MHFDKINHPVEIYHYCTLVEVGLLFISVLAINTAIWMPIAAILYSKSLLGLALSILLTPIITRGLIYKIAAIKKGKPYGYYQQVFRLWLHKKGLIQLPLILKHGFWSAF